MTEPALCAHRWPEQSGPAWWHWCRLDAGHDADSVGLLSLHKCGCGAFGSAA